MTDRPILFSGPMVRALIEGRKTQTRRVLKPPRGAKNSGHTILRDYNKTCEKALWWWDGKHDRVGWSQALPYAIGDRLWCREAHYSTHRSPVDGNRIYYRADCDELAEEMLSVRWSPSIHMPRWASRLTLTVTDVRVERLQDISEKDAIAEGISLAPHRRPAYRVEVKTPNHLGVDAVDADKARSCFMRLWQTIHGPEAWDANDWVCALTFTVEERNIDA